MSTLGDLTTHTERELRDLFRPGTVLEALDGYRYLMKVRDLDKHFVRYDTWTPHGPYVEVYYQIGDFTKIPLAPRDESEWLCAILEGSYVRD